MKLFTTKCTYSPIQDLLHSHMNVNDLFGVKSIQVIISNKLIALLIAWACKCRPLLIDAPPDNFPLIVGVVFVAHDMY